MRRFKVVPHPPRTLAWWHTRKDLIDMSPPYQRRGWLWSELDKAYLIDSILNGFDVPKLYLADFQLSNSELNRKGLPYAIIDGKQRLEAVFDFFDNKFRLDIGFVWREDPDLELGGLYFKELRSRFPKVAEQFENESLDFMSVFSTNEPDIHELFIRLNRSKPLTGAEVRNAVVGPVPETARELAGHSFFTSRIRFKVDRGEDLNTAAKILMFEYAGTTTGTKKADLDRFAEFQEVQPELSDAYSRCVSVLEQMNDIFRHKDSLLRSSGSIPVYYWFIRNQDQQRHIYVRSFLEEFAEARRILKEMTVDADMPPVWFDLLRYDRASRSANDAGSHAVRVEILEHLFEGWHPQHSALDILGLFETRPE